MKNKSENRTINAYFCAITFCFPPKPLPLPLPLPLLLVVVLLLPSSFIATGGLGFPVFLFEDARILFFFFCVTSCSLPSSFRLFAAFSSPFSRLYNTNREEQKKRRNLNEEQRTRDEFLFFSITQHSRQLIKRDLNKDRLRDKSATNLFLPPTSECSH